MVTKTQVAMAIILVFFFAVGIDYYRSVQNNDKLRHGCAKGNAAREFDYTFVQAAIKVRQQTIEDPTTPPDEREAAVKAVASYVRSRDAYERAYADVRQPGGATPLTVDCDRLFPTPKLFGI